MSNEVLHIDWLTTPDNERYEMNTSNTSIHLYLGAKAVYDHIYVDIDDTDPGMGMYIWSDLPIYQPLYIVASRLGAEIESDQTEVHPTKLQVFEERALRDLNAASGLPEEWFS